jgi:DNA-binding beta-propeller fold protein YncE
MTDDLAVDWINDKLYWTDATLQKVEVMDLHSGYRTTLFDTGVGTTPRGIAVDPSTR